MLTAAALLSLCGTALGQNALGSGRALDGGLSATPGGRINASTQDLQAIVRFNTNAGNALNGPGYVNTNGPRGSSFAARSGNLSSFGVSANLSTLTLSGMRNYQASSGGGLNAFDTVGALEAGYLPGGALTSAVDLPQGTTASAYSRASDQSVGYLRTNQGSLLVARGSTLRGLTLEPVDTGAAPAPGTAAVTLATDANYGRVLDDLRRASASRTPGSVNRVDTSATTPPPSTPPSTAVKPTATPPGAQPATPPADDPAETIKRLRERLATAKPKPVTPDGQPIKPDAAVKPDPSNAAATPTLSEDDITALRAMGVRLDSLVPAGSSDAQAADGYTRLGQEALAAGRFGLADQMFQSALSRTPTNVLAKAGDIHATMGLGLLMSAGADLRAFFIDHPEMIPVRYDAAVLMPRGRADRLAEMITSDLDRPDGPLLPDSGLMLAYLGRQFDNGAWLTRGLTAMAAQTRNDPSGAELHTILSQVWAPQTPAPPVAPTPAKPTPAGPPPAGPEPAK